MISAVTREEHYHALRGDADSLGYCKNLFYDKTDSKLPQGEFFSKLKVWLTTKALQDTIKSRQRVTYGLLGGTEKIKKYYSQKFA